MVAQGGESLFLYVTVFDGQLTHKSEVWVDIMNTTGLQDSRRPVPPKIPSNMGPQFRAPPPLPGSVSSGKFRPPPPWLPGAFPSIPYHQHSRPANRTTITARPPAAVPTSTSTQATSTPEGPQEADAEDNTQKNKVLQVSTTPTDDNPAVIQNLALSIISLVLVCTAFLVTAISACVFRNRICNSKKKSKKGDKVRLKFK